MKKVHDLLRYFRKGKGIQLVILGLQENDLIRVDFLNNLSKVELEKFKSKFDNWKKSNKGFQSSFFFLETDLCDRLEGKTLQQKKKGKCSLTWKQQEKFLDAWHNSGLKP